MFVNYVKLLGGVFLGWSLGTNDAANVFGTAVASHMVKFRSACIFMAIFIILGAVISGAPCVRTIGGLAGLTINKALIVTVAAAITTTIMTFLHLPISTSQAVVGAIIGISIVHGQINFMGLKKIVICWIATPIGGAFFAVVLYVLLGKAISNLKIHFLTYDRLMRILLIASGSYSAYALGANNSANATGVFYQIGMLSAHQAAIIGGVSIAIGAVTFSRNVMLTVGRRLLNLDAFSAFIVILSEAITVHIFAIIGVPVSTSQAVVGGVLGVGIVKGMRTVDMKTLCRILYAWIFTPVIGAVISYIIYKLFC